jgi:ABC-type glutathione transport system ATPase component
LLAGNASPNGYIKAVDGVSLTVRSGELLGLLGESGSGKTTLVRTILRLTEPTSGQAWFAGRDIFTMSEAELKTHVRRRLRMIFQHPDAVLNPAYTVKMALEQALSTHTKLQPGERHDRIIDLLQNVGLPAYYLNKHPHELSGGEKRRITICRALATNPAVIFADEPLSGLDVSLQYQVLDLLLRIRQARNLTIVLILHDIGLVQRACDRIAIMYAGRIVELGRTEEVSPRKALHPYTRSLYASHLSIDSAKDGKRFKKISIAEADLTESEAKGGCPYWVSCPLWRERGKPDICLQTPPKLMMKSHDHSVACYLAE